MKRMVIPVMFRVLFAAAKPTYCGTYRGTMGEFTLEPRDGKVHLDFSGKSAASVESEHCGYFHGASCEFDGEYKREKRQAK